MLKNANPLGCSTTWYGKHSFLYHIKLKFSSVLPREPRISHNLVSCGMTCTWMQKSWAQSSPDDYMSYGSPLGRNKAETFSCL